ncbi:MAG: glycerol-3-phosphate dehydrogenase subunit GlpB [Propionibacteriaceae bacterium]|jgi:glycerol-3-phosphate dehydrogenase subunit B|nr:glycerol-3-phosphate dehydrogenase subunit GlpB [Propionibacteriaceae bacterium]
MATALVIGAGLAGLAAAIRLAQAGWQTTLASKGLGGLPLSAGTVDVLGYAPALLGDPTGRVARPFETAAALAAHDPSHPYAAIGADRAEAAVGWLRDLLPELLTGDLKTNITLPTAVGALRPTCLVQPAMAAGDLAQNRSLAIVGPSQLKDFSPELCAANLARQTWQGRPLLATAYRIDLPARPDEADSPALAYARSLDQTAYQRRFAEAVKRRLKDEEAVGLPAVLGLRDRQAWLEVQESVGRPVFEIPLPPPSVPGLRLNDALTAAAQTAGVRLVLGSSVIGFAAAGRRLKSVTLRQAGRDQAWAADAFVYAPGGFESGALSLDAAGRLEERVFQLPLRGAGGSRLGGQETAADLGRLINADYWAEQRLFAAGVAVDQAMRPLDEGEAVFDNLHIAGGLLAGAVRWSEKSGEGIAVGSAAAAADAITGRR